MTGPGAVRYTYPALGGSETESHEPQFSAPRPLPPPAAHAAGAFQPEPDAAARAAADAIVRAALARKPSDGARLSQPEIIPLRPLGLSEIYNGAVAVVRSNPKAVLGFSAVVLAVGAVLQAAVLAPALRWALRTTGAFGSSVGPDSPDGRSTVSLVASLADAPVALVAATLIAGCVMPVLARALASAQGRRGPEPARSVWQETRGRALSLFGLACAVLAAQASIVLSPVAMALLMVAGGFPTPGVVLLLVFAEPLCLLLAYVVNVFLSLAAPAMMSERLGVLAACRRSAVLVRRGFWKILGVGLLTSLLTAIVGLSLSLPFTIVGEVFASDKAPDGHSAVLGTVLLALGKLLSGSVLAPFAASVTALLYVDQRMRQEAYDLVLLGQSGAEAGRTEEGA